MPALEISFRQPVSDRRSRLLGDLELDWPPRLLLDHGGAIPHPAADGYVVDLQRDEIAAAQLAVYREIEQREIALPALKLKPNPDRPDIFRLERALLADQTTLVPGRFRKANNGWERSVHGCLLDPDRAR